MALRELLLTLFLFSKLSPSTADIEAGSQVWEAKENFQFAIAEGNVEVECSLLCYDIKQVIEQNTAKDLPSKDRAVVVFQSVFFNWFGASIGFYLSNIKSIYSACCQQLLYVFMFGLRCDKNESCKLSFGNYPRNMTS